MTPTAKRKKSEKNKERSAVLGESVEYKDVETPAVEVPARAPPAVETPAASIFQEADRGDDVDSFADLQSSRRDDISATDEGQEYPFPVLSGARGLQEKDFEVSKVRDRAIELAEEDIETPLGTGKKGKKAKKNKKSKDKDITSRAVEDSDKDLGLITSAAIAATSSAVLASEGSKERPPHERAEPHKRRSHPVSFHEEQPDEKRLHADLPRHEHVTIERSMFPAESSRSMGRATVKEEKQLTPRDDLTTTVRNHSPNPEPTWSFAGVADIVSQEPPSPIQQKRELVMDTSPKEKRERPTEAIASRNDKHEASHASLDPSLLTGAVVTAAATLSSAHGTTKDRKADVPEPTSVGHIRTPKGKKHAKETTTNIESSRDIAQPETSPAKSAKQKGPSQSLFGDPSEKKADASGVIVTPTPTPKHNRTPGTKQLDTIKESSPDDSPLHKKGRSVTDVGMSERGVKSARHARSPLPFSERIKSPPPVTPTPASRKGVPAALDVSASNTPSRDSPWHQVHESVDRSMTLSPARRMPRGSPNADPIKQQMAEQRSPSVASQRSMSNISKLRSPDHDRPSSAASNRSTHSLRRVDRSASGDLRTASRLGEASASGAGAKDAEPHLSDNNALTAGALAAVAVAGVAAVSKYDPVRGEGKGRRASMAETFVSAVNSVLPSKADTRTGSMGRGARFANVAHQTTQCAQATEHANTRLAVATGTACST